MTSRRAQLRSRERWLIGGIGFLVLLGIIPAFGSTFARSALSPLAGIDHIGTICLIALHFLLTPVHYAIQGMFVIGLVYATWDRASAWYAMQRTLQWLPAVAPDRESVFARAALRAGLPLSSIRVVDGLANPAFTVGWWRPCVYVASSLEHYLSFDELTAVFKHEAVHVARRDPLRLSVLRFFACLLFWIPVLRRLVDEVADEAELDADRHAAGDTPLVLASALVTLAHWNHGTAARVATAVGFTRDDILSRRVLSLAGEPVAARSRVSRGVMMFAAAAVTLVWGVGMVVSHPMPHSALHTGHSFKTNWECLSARMTDPAHKCPHQAQLHGDTPHLSM